MLGSGLMAGKLTRPLCAHEPPGQLSASLVRISLISWLSYINFTSMPAVPHPILLRWAPALKEWSSEDCHSGLLSLRKLSSWLSRNASHYSSLVWSLSTHARWEMRCAWGRVVSLVLSGWQDSSDFPLFLFRAGLLLRAEYSVPC